MEIVQIFFIFMITTSLTLTGFVIRQRKNNRMLGELVAQNKVSGHDRYSRLNVGVKNQEYVSKCPSCAEWINLEAKVCKSCQLSVTEHNHAKKEAMRLLDQEAKELRMANYAQKRRQLQAIKKNRFFRTSIALTLVVVLFFAMANIVSVVKYKKATSMPASAAALSLSWDSAVTGCREYGVAVHPVSKISKDGTVYLSFILLSNAKDLDWDSSLGKEITCFAKKALGVDVSKKLNLLEYNEIELPNGFSISSDPDRQFIRFDWYPAS
jgi:hypothetical protein